jgi:23S rRNA (pseudouridine1915-N3)-methyltransferase
VYLEFLWVGRTREPDLAAAIDRYRKRLEHYAEVRVRVAADAGRRAGRRPADVARREGEGLLRLLPARGRILGLDPGGRLLTSERFAAMLESELRAGGGRVTFVIGGPTGLAPEVRDRLDRRLALTPMTLTHEMARLVLVEQVYRAFTILRGGAYHK